MNMHNKQNCDGCGNFERNHDKEALWIGMLDKRVTIYTHSACSNWSISSEYGKPWFQNLTILTLTSSNKKGEI